MTLLDIADEAQIEVVEEHKLWEGLYEKVTFPSFKDLNIQIQMPTPENFSKHDKIRSRDKTISLGTFKGFKLMEVSNLADQARADANIGLWEEQNDPKHIDFLAEKFLVNDFDISHYPPIVDENDEIIEGRSRSLAADQIGAVLIPVAIYEWNVDVTERQKHDAKFGVHLGRQAERTLGMGDFVSDGYSQWSKGWISEHYEDIHNWVVNESGASDLFVSTNLTKIAQRIEKKISHSKSGEVQNTLGDVKFWNNWIQNNLGLDDSEYYLVNTGNEGYAERALVRGLFPNPSNKIIFYASDEFYSDSKAKLSKSIAKMESVHRKSLKHAADHFNSHIVKIDTNSIKAKYEIIGHIPQNSGYHEKYIKENKLVPIEEY